MVEFEDIKVGILIIIPGWDIVGRVCEIDTKKKRFTLAGVNETVFNKKTRIFRAGTVRQKKSWWYPSFCILGDSPHGQERIKAMEVRYA